MANEKRKRDRVFTEYNVTYTQEISWLKKRIASNPPKWDLGQDFDGNSNASCPTLQDQVSKIAQSNKAMFDSHAAIFKNLITKILTSNITSDGALERNLESHFIYHSIMTFNCIALPIVLGILMKCVQFASGINVMKRDNFRRCYLGLCFFSMICVCFDSKLTILLPWYVTETCIQLTATLSKLQTSFGLYDTSDFFDKVIKNCPLKTTKYEHLNSEAVGFGSAPFALQLHKLFTYLMHATRSHIGFWDSGELALSVFISYQAVYWKFQKYIDPVLTKIKDFTQHVAFGPNGAAQ
jgi:hypothetical protein